MHAPLTEMHFSEIKNDKIYPANAHDPMAACQRTTRQSDVVIGSNIYSHLTLDLPDGLNGKSADYSGSTWESRIRKVLIAEEMRGPQGMNLEGKALPGRKDIDQEA